MSQAPTDEKLQKARERGLVGPDEQLSDDRIANLIFLSPPVSHLLLYLVRNEPLLPSTLVGLTLILAGLAAQNLKPRKAPPPTNRPTDADAD